MEFFDSFSTLTLTLLVIIAAMSCWFAGPGYNSHSARHSPAILTSSGIFGTFLGVALGLLHFDTGDIQASVPSLIEGLRTAFWTSIAGLLGALAVKFRHLQATRQQASAQPTTNLSDLAQVLQGIRSDLDVRLGEGEGNLVRREIAMLREDQGRGLSALSRSFTHYQEGMVDANRQALVTALEEIMQNFNDLINTQYGDNFQQLNEAVGNMLVWQQGYKEELQELMQSQQSNGALLEKASSAYERMVGHTEVFQEVSDSLGGMLTALQSQSSGLDQYLSQLAQVAVKATEGLPSLEGRIDALTSELARSVSESQQRMSDLLVQSAQQMTATSTEINQSLSASLQASQHNLQQRFESMLESTESQVMRLDDAMEAELTKALKTFGYQLTSLSEKFVHDYAPLTERLHDLIRLAESSPPRQAGVAPVRSRNLAREGV